MEQLHMVTCNEPTLFRSLISFELEVTNPAVLKRELDLLIARLGHVNAVHANRVVTRAIANDKTRGVVTMQVMVPLRDPKSATRLLADNSRYWLIPEYEIGPSHRISIRNDRDLFRQAAVQFLQLGSGAGLEQFDPSRQHIIEVSRIDLYGNVLGFDLYMEDRRI